MKDMLIVIFGILMYGFMLLVLPALFWKPGFSTVKDFVNANQIGSRIYQTDPNAELCLDKKWLSRDFYIKSQGKVYYIGYGVYSMKNISNDRIKEVSEALELDKCEKLK